MTPADVLRAARAKIERGWIQGWLFRDPDGHCSNFIYFQKRACAWCASGALMASSDAGSARERAYSFLYSVTGPSIPEWNDAEGRTQAEVLQAFDAAIALAEADPSQ